MPKTPTFGTARGGITFAVVLLSSVLNTLAQQVAPTQIRFSTVAYHFEDEGYRQLEGFYASVLGLDTWDLVRREGQPKPMAAFPWKSRFLKKGDELYLLTDRLRTMGILGPKDTWAVYNASKQRLVMRGGKEEHQKFEHFWQRLRFQAEVAVQYRLLKVRCQEAVAVAWTRERVKERLVKELGAVHTLSRSGEDVSVMVRGDGGTEVSVDSEVELDRSMIVGTLTFDLKAKLPGTGFGPTLSLGASVWVYRNEEMFLEIGSQSDPKHTLLLGITAVSQYRNALPIWQWRETEDGNDRRKSIEAYPGQSKNVIDEAELLVGVWEVKETLFTDISGEGGPVLQELPEKAPRYLPYHMPHDELFDVSKLMREAGIDVPKDGWMLYNKTSGQLSGRIDGNSCQLVDQLLSSGHSHPPILKKTTVSLVTWDGENPEGGELPAIFTRMARLSTLSEWDHKETRIKLGRLGNGELAKGVELKGQTVIGNSLATLDYELTHMTDRLVGLTNTAQVVTGNPTLFPLGKSQGRRMGLLVEIEKVSISGEEIGR